MRFLYLGHADVVRGAPEGNPNSTEEEIKEGIEGNICRCTGYNSIVRAVEAVAKGNYREE